jgi:hypothetical protein
MECAGGKPRCRHTSTLDVKECGSAFPERFSPKRSLDRDPYRVPEKPRIVEWVMKPKHTQCRHRSCNEANLLGFLTRGDSERGGCAESHEVRLNP